MPGRIALFDPGGRASHCARMMQPPTIDDIRSAAQRIEGAVIHTPMLMSRTFSEIVGAEVWFKFENLQFTGAYKERGALNKLLQLTGEERSRGVIAADRKSTRLNSSHLVISYAVFCLKKKKRTIK